MSLPVERPRTWRRLVTADDSRAWAWLLRDDNPLHANPGAAGANGLGSGVVNPGPAGIGYLMTMLLEEFPDAEIRRFHARFNAPVLTPTEVEARGQVTRREADSSGDILHVTLELHARGMLAIRAEAVARLPAGRP